MLLNPYSIYLLVESLVLSILIDQFQAKLSVQNLSQGKNVVKVIQSVPIVFN